MHVNVSVCVCVCVCVCLCVCAYMLTGGRVVHQGSWLSSGSWKFD